MVVSFGSELTIITKYDLGLLSFFMQKMLSFVIVKLGALISNEIVP
jgi:hypothetical protein